MLRSSGTVVPTTVDADDCFIAPSRTAHVHAERTNPLITVKRVLRRRYPSFQCDLHLLLIFLGKTTNSVWPLTKTETFGSSSQPLRLVPIPTGRLHPSRLISLPIRLTLSINPHSLRHPRMDLGMGPVIRSNHIHLSTDRLILRHSRVRPTPNNRAGRSIRRSMLHSPERLTPLPTPSRPTLLHSSRGLLTLNKLMLRSNSPIPTRKLAEKLLPSMVPALLP